MSASSLMFGVHVALTYLSLIFRMAPLGSFTSFIFPRLVRANYNTAIMMRAPDSLKAERSFKRIVGTKQRMRNGPIKGKKNFTVIIFNFYYTIFSPLYISLLSSFFLKKNYSFPVTTHLPTFMGSLLPCYFQFQPEPETNSVREGI